MLIVILLRAGLELRRDTLNRVGRTALVIVAAAHFFSDVAGTGPTVICRCSQADFSFDKVWEILYDW
ncbi:MAG: hypothetical protein U5R49_11205 [Deltaproteobacteria bacterium]|nr:hypothetical protein [Deltaproteobacteria bacterium]